MSNRFFPPQLHQYISTSQTEGLRLSRLLPAAAGLTSYKVNKMAVVTEVCSGVLVVFVNFGVHRALRTSYSSNQVGTTREVNRLSVIRRDHLASDDHVRFDIQQFLADRVVCCQWI
ncbi:hypothetical protein Pcinc_026966 [Petrolisthes cinctipes]|uniref:Uncharacterized protein n=1 Tax=Petrolisthes cinctipes TaxID=88211 RepID=A0AAE1F5X6_PETCI|nr:hypothetical protein Pcinc_026966 [Petrolisthes cinctipes]